MYVWYIYPHLVDFFNGELKSKGTIPVDPMCFLFRTNPTETTKNKEKLNHCKRRMNLGSEKVEALATISCVQGGPLVRRADGSGILCACSCYILPSLKLAYPQKIAFPKGNARFPTIHFQGLC